MALRSPVPFHNFWGADYAGAAFLPNTPGLQVLAAPLNLEAGDFAYVPTASTFYICTDPGTINNGGDAVWVQVTTGAATIDRFAPRYIVGGPNDSATAYNSGGFQYIPSNLNATWQTDLQNALNAVPGDVHFRPGTFSLDGPITMPDPVTVGPCSVRGAGRSTIFTTTASLTNVDGKLGAFVLRAGSTLSDCAIAADAPAASTDATTLGVVYVYEGSTPRPGTAHIENVYATYALDPTSSVTACRSIYRVGASMGARFSDCDNLLTGTLGGGSSSLCGWYAAASSTALVISSSSHSTGVNGDAAVICDGLDLSISQLGSKDTSSVGVGVYSGAVVNIVNSRIEAALAYAVDIGSASATIGLSNSYLTTADNVLPAFHSIGSGRIVGNTIFSLAAAVDTLLCVGHAIGFNVFSGTVTTTPNDEVAHNI